MLMIITAAVQTPPVLKWDEKKWPKTAITLRLVLVGWGPSMPCLPNQDWIERRRGGLTQVHWQNLVNRIPESWHNNPYHKVSDVELALRFMPLDEFLLGSPRMLTRLLLLFFANHFCLRV